MIEEKLRPVVQIPVPAGNGVFLSRRLIYRSDLRLSNLEVHRISITACTGGIICIAGAIGEQLISRCIPTHTPHSGNISIAITQTSAIFPNTVTLIPSLLRKAQAGYIISDLI
ncbi:hypothetical protein D3C84_997480 [compost metagenome]